MAELSRHFVLIYEVELMEFGDESEFVSELER
ncbi:hypothetical protein J2S19_004883 [Metabacillus malikii]|uniref:Uncharacterized protein n=1 Tax=Metabacillus malikii TaxID=1504265 RepID=A0ABT9ZML7_9BACI|nr:hypothetical protein [Metabacillus malikii]